MWAIMTPKEKMEARQHADEAAKAAAPGLAAVSTMRHKTKKGLNKMPCMPTMNSDSKWVHREKCGDEFGLGGLAVVARSVKPKELKLNKKALAAMEKEWSALREVGAWEEKRVREWADVREEAKRKSIRMHVGMVFGICVEKGSELPEGNPQRKYKGRVVFRGSDVRDESHFLATFQDLGSAPASMSSGKFLDFLGLLPAGS
jgi:hypothetical protein